MSGPISGRSFLLLVALCIEAACAGMDQSVSSLDLSLLEPDEGIVVAIVSTSRVRTEGDRSVTEQNADVSYSIHYGDSRFSQLAGDERGRPYSRMSSAWYVEGTEGEAPFVRKLRAGKYYFNLIRVRFGGPDLWECEIELGFDVAAGNVTYLGHLELLFHQERKWLGTWDYSEISLLLRDDRDTARAMLAERFGPTVPEFRIAPLEFE